MAAPTLFYNFASWLFTPKVGVGQTGLNLPLAENPIGTVANAALTLDLTKAASSAPASNNHSIVKYLVEGGMLSSAILVVVGVASNSLLTTTFGVVSTLGGVAGMYATRELGLCQTLQQENLELVKALNIERQNLAEMKKTEADRERTAQALKRAETSFSSTTTSNLKVRASQTQILAERVAELEKVVLEGAKEKIAAEQKIQQMSDEFAQKQLTSLRLQNEIVKQLEEAKQGRIQAIKETTLLQLNIDKIENNSRTCQEQLKIFQQENSRLSQLVYNLPKVSPSPTLDIGAIRKLTKTMQAYQQTAVDVLQAEQDGMHALAAASSVLSARPSVGSSPLIASTSLTPVNDKEIK